MKENFGKEITIFIVRKDFEENTVEDLVEMDINKHIDYYCKDNYTKEELKKIL